MVWKDQTQRTWSGLAHIAQLVRLYAGPFLITIEYKPYTWHQKNQQKGSESPPLFSTPAVCRAFFILLKKYHNHVSRMKGSIDYEIV